MANKSTSLSPERNTGFYPIPHQYDYDAPTEVTDVNQRGQSPENDAHLDKLQELRAYHAGNAPLPDK